MAKKIKILSSLAGYDLAAGDYDKKEKYLDSFEKDSLLPLLGDIKGKKILDVGAGTGRVSLRLATAGAIVIALDVSEKMLARLKQKNSAIYPVKSPQSGVAAESSQFNGVKTIVGDAESLPFDNDSFDFVVAAFLIVHLKDPAHFFDEAYRVLKSGGKLVVTNVNQKEPPEIETNGGTFKIESYYHRPEKIKEILGELAFSVEKEEIVKENEVWVNQIIVAKK